jgi:hypothetical protein
LRNEILLLGHAFGNGRILLWHPGSRPRPLVEASDGYSGGGAFFSGMTDGSWSPDGRSIAFESDTPGGLAPPTPNVLVMRSNGTDVKTLSSGHMGAGWGLPSWSPDGRQVVYERDSTNIFSGASWQNFAIVDVSSGSFRTLPASLATGDPVWGTPGIAYTSNTGIMLLDPASGESRLVTGDVTGGTLAWSPGGELAALEPTHVVLLAASGRVLGTLPIPPAARPACDIAWSPDGTQILLSTAVMSKYEEQSMGRLWVGTVSTKRWRRLAPVPSWRKDAYDCAVSWR